MNQDKIGKLIAKKRKEKGLTQRELGDMVGVGYRAVSKWETGLTMPDISIINDLSNILGITSDELLKGELNIKSDSNEIPNKVDFNKKYLLLIIPFILVVVVTVILFNWHNDDMDVASVGADDATALYELIEIDDDAFINGKITGDNQYITIFISEIGFNDDALNNIVISGCQYELFYNDNFIYGYVYSEDMKNLTFPVSIGDFIKNLKIDYSLDSAAIDYDSVFDSNLKVKFNFVAEDGKIIERVINARGKIRQ